MGEDDLLKALGRLGREDRESEASALDERWDALAAGELSAEEVRALEREAEESEEAARAWAAFQPLGADRRRAVLDAARAAHDAAGREEAGTSPTVRPFRPRSVTRRAMRWLPAAALVAASLVLLLRTPAEVAPLPGYVLEIQGTAREVRGAGDATPAPEVLRLAPGSRLRLGLAPEVAVDGPVEAAVYLGSTGALRRLEEAGLEVAESGSVRLLGTVGRDLDLPAGAAELVVVIARPGGLPSAAELEALEPGESRAEAGDWVAWRLPVWVEADG